MALKRLLCAVCLQLLYINTNAYYPTHIEGTDVTYRNLRSVGPRRKQIKEELLTMLGIPSLWRRSNSREVRNLEASLERKFTEKDPTANADSLFMLDIYNQLTDSAMGTENELSILSKPALTIRKIRKTRTGDFPSETLRSNLLKLSAELTDESDKIITIQDKNKEPSQTDTDYKSTLNFSVPKDENSELSVATLRIFKRLTEENLMSNVGNRTLTLMVNEIIPSKIIGNVVSDEVSKLKLKAMDVGWFELDVTNIVHTWRKDPFSNQGLSIKVLDDHGTPYPLQHVGLTGATYESDRAPFLVLYHKNEDFHLQQEEVVEQRSRRAAAKRDSRYNDYDYDSGDDESIDEERSAQRTSRRKSTRSAPNSPKKKNTRKKNRKKQNNKCTKKRGCKRGPKKTLCSRDRMYLDFREIGWHQYIIAPEGYAAYRCRGECDLPLNPQVNATNHAIVQAIVASMNSKIPKPCCAPLKLEQLTVVYHDEDNRVILRKYKEMVVRSCGCH